MGVPSEGREDCVFDDTEVDAEGRLVVRCEDAPEDATDLAKPECLKAVLGHLRDGGRVHGVVLVHDRERAYGRRAMAALEALLALGRLLEQLGRRAPAPHFPGFTAKETAAVCAKCPLRPAPVFARLRARLLGDPAAFLEALREIADTLAAYSEEGCSACAGATIQDLRVVLTEVERAGGA